MIKFTIAFREIGTYKEVLYSKAHEKYISLKKGTKADITAVLEDELYARFNLVTALSNIEAKNRVKFLEALISGTMDAFKLSTK
ncbi:hypothetical protein M5K25_022137 [Dendrobium thyrsiflorum]|uniref:Uncharacterized protein n=1 Tax=Dendrobium thyrsiflorum TaxID=117978 RepID=A0ABD0UBM0_DENTH